MFLNPAILTHKVVDYAKHAVATINSLIQSRNIKMVFITGDLTNTYVPILITLTK